MKTVVVGSVRRSTGKTSSIVGISKASGMNVGYLKPLGDHSTYNKKRLWDGDAALVTELFDLDHEPEDITIGFDHSKLRYAYTPETTREKLQELVERVGKGKDVVFVEGGRDLTYGASISLDPVAVTKALDASLVLVISGDSDCILDDIAFVSTYIDTSDIAFAGIIINKAPDQGDVETMYRDAVEKAGVPLLGTIPYQTDLANVSVRHLVNALFAKVIAGEDGLDKIIEHTVVGTMSGDSLLRDESFEKERKLIITSGDRTDIILAALEGGTSAIVLTGDIRPPTNILSRATERNVPLLLVQSDAYRVVQQAYEIEPLLLKSQTGKIALLENLFKNHVDIGAILKKSK